MVKNRFSTSKSSKNYNDWFNRGSNGKPKKASTGVSNKITVYKMTTEELEELRLKERKEYLMKKKSGELRIG